MSISNGAPLANGNELICRSSLPHSPAKRLLRTTAMVLNGSSKRTLKCRAISFGSIWGPFCKLTLNLENIMVKHKQLPKTRKNNVSLLVAKRHYLPVSLYVRPRICTSLPGPGTPRGRANGTFFKKMYKKQTLTIETV